MAIPQDVYRDIIRTAQSIVLIAEKSSTEKLIASTVSGSDAELELPQLQFSSILSLLLDDGVPSAAAEKLSQLFMRLAADLRERFLSSLRDTRSKVSQLPRHSSMLAEVGFQKQLISTYKAVYEQRLSSWISEIRRMASTRAKTMRSHTYAADRDGAQNQTGQKTFNHNYVPILETFFAEEQFPSRADKVFLAKKAGMTYRQIHVWFQNRRSRTRRGLLNKGGFSQASHSDCDSSEDTDVEDFHVKSDFSSRASSFTLVADDYPLEARSPRHAFPQKYPPDFDDKSDPFPCRFGDFSSFPKANWDRKCSVLPRGQNDVAVDIDELSESFGKLRIRSASISERAEADYPCTWGSYNPRTLSGCDVMAAYTTRPLRAPIPSFIRYPLQERDLPSCTMLRPQRRDLLLAGPNVSSLHSHDTPSNYKSACKTKRFNKPRLPKRVPTNRPKLFATSKPRSELIGLANTDEADTCTRGRTLTPLLQRVATLTRSASSSSDESLPSLTPSFSSSSSSEAQSPYSPAQGLPDESTLCFLPELSTIAIPDASQGLLADIPFSLFAPSDFNYDLLSSKPFVDNAYDLPFSHSQADPFLSLQLQPPPAIPQSLPFSFDFVPLTS